MTMSMKRATRVRLNKNRFLSRRLRSDTNLKSMKKLSEKHKKIVLKFLTEKLCQRPSMFTGRPGFERVGNYFDGYSSALEEHLGVDITKGFNYWLAEEIKAPYRNVIWWVQMIDVYKTEEKALKMLPILMDRFLRSEEFDTFELEDWSTYKKKPNKNRKKALRKSIMK